MKKVLIGFVFVLCLVGGVAIGKIRQKAKAPAGGGLVMDAGHSDAAASPEGSPSEMAEVTETPADGTMAESTGEVASETPTEMASADTESSSMDDAAMTAPTPEVSSDPTAVSGRSFGTGTKSRTKRSSSSSDFSASSAIADSSFSEPPPKKARPAGTPIPENQVIDVSTPTDDSGAGSVSSFDVPPSGGSASSSVASGGSDLDDLPVIDDGGAASSDPFADTSSSGSTAAAAPTPDPFANAVAMAPSGGGELVFPSGSGRTVKKVTQKQSGSATVVRIELSGSAKSRVFKTRAGKVFVDIEDTDVPGGPSQSVAGSGQVREISARATTTAGGMKMARVQILVNVANEKMPNISKEDAGNTVIVTIGGASSSEF